MTSSYWIRALVPCCVRPSAGAKQFLGWFFSFFFLNLFYLNSILIISHSFHGAEDIVQNERWDFVPPFSTWRVHILRPAQTWSSTIESIFKDILSTCSVFHMLTGFRFQRKIIALTPGRCGHHFKNTDFKLMIQNNNLVTHCDHRTSTRTTVNAEIPSAA